MANKLLNLNDKKLVSLYVNSDVTCQDLAGRFGCTDVTIRNRLVKNGIVLKHRGRRKFKYKKFPFDGDILEKMYMIGFRIGDLNVYRPRYKNSRIIVVRCHTTQQDQVKIMRNIFSPYGKVKISISPKFSFHINCYLDQSFSFLIDKTLPGELNQSRANERRWAFIAGYTDAEGNFILNQGRARSKIDSYDYHVLAWMHSFFGRQGIKSKFRRIALKNTPYPFAAKGMWKNDLWRLNVNEAKSLKEMIGKLLPFLKHRKRINDVKLCLKNIYLRSYGKSY